MRLRVLVIAALLVVGCSVAPAGGSPSAPADPSAGPASLPHESASSVPVPSSRPSGAVDLAGAAVRTAEAGSIGYALTVEYHGGERDGLVHHGTGQTATDLPRRSWTEMDSFVEGRSTRMIIDDTRVYVSGPGFDNQVRPDQWLLLDLASDDPGSVYGAEQFVRSLDARFYVYLLFGVDTASTEVVGREDVGGVPTTRVAGGADIARAHENAPAELAPVLAPAAGQAKGRLFDAEWWIGDDGLVHRVRFEPLGNEGDGRAVYTFDLEGFGEPVELPIPDPDDVVVSGEPRPS